MRWPERCSRLPRVWVQSSTDQARLPRMRQRGVRFRRNFREESRRRIKSAVRPSCRTDVLAAITTPTVMAGTIPGSSPGTWAGHDDETVLIAGASELMAAGLITYAPIGSAATSAAALAAGDPIACTDASVAAASATSSLRNMAIFGRSTASGRPSR